MLLKTVWVLIMTVAIPISAGASTQRRVALVIGNGAYTHANKLPNPPHDAADMAGELRNLGFEVFELEDGSRDQMARKLLSFEAALSKDDVAVIFYAGHGIEAGGENFLIPVDSDIPDESALAYQAVRLNDVLEQLDQKGTSANLIFLDACRNNPFARKFRGGGPGGLSAVTEMPVGTVIEFAAAPKHVAADGDGRNGLFTSALLKAIETPGLAIEGVVKFTISSVRKASGGQQQPWANMSFEGEFYFKPIATNAPARSPEVAQGSPAPTKLEAVANTRECQSCGAFRVVSLAPGLRVSVNITPVTVGQWRVCAREGRCAPLADASENAGVPVTGISFNDAQVYLRWLSEKGGRVFRLLTASEWSALASSQKEAGQTTIVGHVRAAAVGASDIDGIAIGGNVSEWTRSCADGQAEPDCQSRVVEGLSWRDAGARDWLRSRSVLATARGDTIGFRAVSDGN